MLAGERLFAGASEVDVIAKLLKREIKAPGEHAPGIPKALDEIVMRGLSADVNERFATARELCVALGGCGVQESAGIAVGEWVEGLATEALAVRSARIAAIESHPEAEAEGVWPHPSTPPLVGSEDDRVAPNESGAIPIARSKRATAEGGADPTSITISAAPVHRDVRVVVGAAAGAAVCIAGLAFAFARGGGHRPGSESAPSPSPPAVAAPPSSPPSPSLPTQDLLLAPSVAIAAPTEVAPSPKPSAARAAAPPPQRAAPAGARLTPRAQPAAAKGASPDSVFDRRE
jgi:hypothetical protein